MCLHHSAKCVLQISSGLHLTFFGKSSKWWLVLRMVQKSLLSLNCNRKGLMRFGSLERGWGSCQEWVKKSPVYLAQGWPASKPKEVQFVFIFPVPSLTTSPIFWHPFLSRFIVHPCTFLLRCNFYNWKVVNVTNKIWKHDFIDTLLVLGSAHLCSVVLVCMLLENTHHFFVWLDDLRYRSRYDVNNFLCPYHPSSHEHSYSGSCLSTPYHVPFGANLQPGPPLSHLLETLHLFFFFFFPLFARLPRPTPVQAIASV